MTYSVTNPPVCVLSPGIPGPGSTAAAASMLAYNSTAPAALRNGSALWLYRSTHSSSEVVASNFFTYADQLGMRVGDVLWNQPQTSAASSKMTMHWVISMTSATTGVAGSTWGARFDGTVASAT